MTYEQICERLARIEREASADVDVDLSDVAEDELEDTVEDILSDAEDHLCASVAALKLDIEIYLRREADKAAQPVAEKSAAA